MISARKALLAVALVLLCCALLNQRWTGWLTGPINGFVHTVQYPAGWLAGAIKPTVGVAYPEAVDSDLQALKQRIREANKYNDELWAENRRLRRQIDTFEVIAEIRDLEEVKLVEAKVSRFNDDPINPTMTLLRGAMHGVQEDDPVVYRFQMLGYIESVGPTTSTATLITKPDYRTEVTIRPPDQDRMENNWPVFARAQSDGKGAFYSDMAKDITKALRVGDVVRISDRLRESANGFVLGEIAEINKHPDRPLVDDRVLIKPTTPIGPQGMVTIITQRTD